DVQASELRLEQVTERRTLTRRFALHDLELLGGGARARLEHAHGEAAILGIEVEHLGLDLVSGLERRSSREFARRNDSFDTVFDANERAVLGHREHGDLLDHGAGREALEHRTPGVVKELANTERDLLLVVVDREDDRLDVVALLVDVAGVVDLDGPAEV